MAPEPHLPPGRACPKPHPSAPRGNKREGHDREEEEGEEEEEDDEDDEDDEDEDPVAPDRGAHQQVPCSASVPHPDAGANHNANHHEPKTPARHRTRTAAAGGRTGHCGRPLKSHWARLTTADGTVQRRFSKLD